ncbi:MAG: ABC transporter substrate-binding protein [Oligoflexales bacterium]
MTTKIIFIFVSFCCFSLLEIQAGTRKVCKDAIRRSQPYYHRLSMYRPPMSQTTSKPYLFSRLQTKHCAKKYRNKSMKIIRHALRKHQNKIGLLLPLSGPYRELSQSLLAGLKQAVQDYNLPPDLFVVRSTTTSKGILEPLSQLVFDDDVAIIIGGLLQNEAEILTKWSDGLERPTLILNQNAKFIENKIYAYQFFPDPSQLAHGLLRQSLTRNFHKIAVLKPSHGGADNIVERFQKKAEELHIEVSEVIPYVPGDFNSMNYAAGAVFHTHSNDRPEEYRDALRKAALAADKAGLPFDSKKVILKPQPKAQAIFIPDDFRTVRHFIKLFRYHGVDQFPLLGHHEWRSKGLTDPWDHFLQDSFFADFIPQYSKLPINISSSNPWFLNPNEVIDADFRMLGFHIGHLTHDSFRKDALRTILIQRLIRAPSLFGKNQQGYFAKDHTSSWPHWILNLQEHGMSLTVPENNNRQHSRTPPSTGGGHG